MTERYLPCLNSLNLPSKALPSSYLNAWATIPFTSSLASVQNIVVVDEAIYDEVILNERLSETTRYMNPSISTIANRDDNEFVVANQFAVIENSQNKPKQ